MKAIYLIFLISFIISSFSKSCEKNDQSCLVSNLPGSYVGTYQLLSKSNGFVAGIMLNSSTPGFPMGLGESSIDENIKLSFYQYPSGQNSYFIQVVSTGYVLDNSGFSTTPGTPIIQWEYNQASEQLWAINNISESWITLENIASNLVLDIQNGNTVLQSTLIQSEYVINQTSQLWALIQINSP